MAALAGSVAVAVIQGLRAASLDPLMLKTLLVAGAPLRFAIAANVWAGRSIKSIAAEVVRRLLELAGWLFGKLSPRRLRGFERAYFPLRRWHVVLAALVAAKAVQWAARRWLEHVSGARLRRKQLQGRMQLAEGYEEWAEAAQELDALRGKDSRSRLLLETRLYDRRLLQERLAHLRRVRGVGDVNEVMFAVRADLIRNLGNMTNSELHEHFPVVPDLIRQYIQQVQADLHLICASPDMPVDEKMAFLRESRHAFGRTALVLSGGGSFGAFHMGIVKALLDANLLPRVVSGSSAGAIVSAILCTRTEAELQDVFDAAGEIGSIEFYSFNTVGQILRHMLLKGTLQDHDVLQDRLRRVLGDMTFAEGYQRSGRILNVSVSAADTSEPPRLLNYLSAPNVLIWSAVACSSAFPFLYAPQRLLARDSRGAVVDFNANEAGEMQRRWRDGSLEEDLPMRGLSEMFNVNYFVVSQANPYVLPLMALKRLVPRRLGNLVEGEFKHRCKQLMEVLPLWVGANRLLKLLNQPWEGDCTMVLPVTTFSTAKSMINLSKADLLVALNAGRRATWAKLSAIQANCAIEATIDDCLRQVTAFANAQRRRAARRGARAAAAAAVGGGGGGGNGGEATMRRSIPSWLHMPSLGIPRSDSRELGLMTPSASRSALATMQSANLDAASSGDLLMHFPGGMLRSPRGGGGSSTALHGAAQEQLTDTVVPEDAEREEEHVAEAAAEAAAAAAAGGRGAGGMPPELASPVAIMGMDDVEEVVEEAPLPASSPSLDCGRELWRDFFSLTPASSNVPCTSLDFIAP
ncbi:hypothetical protein D9Q98_006948 [Chlorella vulgaris]|uniref:PNPLA domain-containing protein n=1 Tax=Chlorella vulgaris TaxID=3077 RepID=A0A9D4TJB7_CHLVU|nr:hypothetical protein D9Q98_006948 [Chlorella vulgaris]